MPWNYNWKLPHYPSKSWATLIREKVWQDNDRRSRFKNLNRRFFPSFGTVAAQASLNFGVSVPNLNTRNFVTDTTMSSDMFDRGAWYDAMYSGLNDPKPGINGTERPADARYASQYRNQKSRFGHKKPYTLRKIKRELRAHDFVLKSRFQTFQDDGFTLGIGGRKLAFTTPNPSSNEPCGLFPFMLFDVTSMPNGVFREPGSGAVSPVMPIRAYQLAFNSSNSTEREFKRYGWIPVNYMDNSAAHNIPSATFPNPFDNKNVAVVTETSGNSQYGTTYPNSEGYPTFHAHGFTHSYSDIKMIMYPQLSLPTKWHVALVSFPDNLVNGLSNKPPFTAGPGLTHMEKMFNNVQEDIFTDKFDPNEYYSARRTIQNEDHDDLDFRWQAFWSGKLQNPINRDISARGTLNPVDKRLPFKIIEHESFMQPARDQGDWLNLDKRDGTKQCQRLIKKLFYRRDWSFPPSEMTQGASRFQGDALYNLNTIQTSANPLLATRGSPFAKPSETVYLAVWCEHFTRDTMPSDHSATWGNVSAHKFPGTDAFPSFDLVVNMKHILRPENINESEAFAPDAPREYVAPTGGTKVEPHVNPDPSDEPIKKKRSKKNVIINAPKENTSPVGPGLDTGTDELAL